MDGKKDESAPADQEAFSAVRGLSRRHRNLLFITESAFVIVLIIVWIASGVLQKSTNLLVLFLYSFPSEFLIAILPHEPVLIYFGRFFTPMKKTRVPMPRARAGQSMPVCSLVGSSWPVTKAMVEVILRWLRGMPA